MNKIEALESIERAWNSSSLTLGEKILSISNDFYAVGLDLATTAAFIKATPAELDALMALSFFDEDIISMISEVNPPKTTWALIANGSDEEVKKALSALAESKDSDARNKETFSEFVYQQMIEVAGPTPIQLISMLTSDELAHVLKKGQDFNALNDWSNKFLKNIVGQKKRGKTLSDKQVGIIIRILGELADAGAIKRDSIDGDIALCTKILDAIDK